MKKRLSAAEIRELQSSGAKVRVVKKPVPHETSAALPKPAEQASPSIAEQAMFELAGSMSASQRAIVEHVDRIVRSIPRGDAKPTAYQFTIKRDRKGLIETIDAHPLLLE